ncbi:hypothetical protein TWF281_006772 [Arthrobotrys megalospora]
MQLDSTELGVLLAVLGIGLIAFLVMFYKFGWFPFRCITRKEKTVNEITREFAPVLQPIFLNGASLPLSRTEIDFEILRYKLTPSMIPMQPSKRLLLLRPLSHLLSTGKHSALDLERYLIHIALD